MLEELLRSLEAKANPEGGPMGRHGDESLPSAEEVEDVESLEGPARIEDLETEVVRAPRRKVNRDEEIEALTQRRRQSVETRSRGHTRKDHAEFDQRIRQVAADQTAVALPAKTFSMREAVIWQEILGPPVGLRDSEPK